MKRLIAFFLSICILVIPVYAEGIDVSSLSDDEISILYQTILDELQLRSLSASGRIYPGRYIVGVDILPGNYIFRFERYENSENYINIRLYNNSEDHDNKIFNGKTLGDFDECYMSLRNDMILEIDYSYATIRIASKSFWEIEK